MRFEIENQKGELKMENENQKPNLSLADICRIQQEICNSKKDCFSQCPFRKNGEGCIISNIDSIRPYADEIEAICIEWEMNKPTLADKINEILKPHGMKLGAGNYICFEDENEVAHAKAELIDKLYTTKWKGDANE
jgi:hypothetical protein